MERVQRALSTLQRQEQIRAGQAAGSGQRPPGDAPRIETRLAREDKPGLGVARAIACILRSHVVGGSAEQIARDAFGSDDRIPLLVRAASAPADVATATWAANLLQEEYGPFWQLIRDISLFGLLPGRRIEVMALTNMPVQAGRGTLAGGFFAPGTPIKVKKGAIDISSVQPHSFGVISAYLNALVRRQTVVGAAEMIRDQIINDSAEQIDTALMSTTARVAGTTPAGLRDTTETGADNIKACTNDATGAGNATEAEIRQDAAGVLSRVNALKINAGVWAMHPDQVRALANKQNAVTGQYPFEREIDAGTFRGFPIRQTTNMTAAIVAFVGADSMVFANELAPRFDESGDAVLHFEDSSPAAIGTAGTPNVIAAPVRSMYQEDSTAIRMIAEMDWRVVRKGGVQILTGADAW